MFDSTTLKTQFPLFKNHADLVYLDNAATSHKPKVVLDAITDYYLNSNANVHRGVHSLSDASTEALESARQKIAAFFGAESAELVLVQNTTQALNGIAYGWADHNLKPGDVIVTTPLEHHSSIVVWQQACLRTGAVLEVVQIDQTGAIDTEHLAQLCKKHGSKMKLMAFVHVSNTLGTVQDVETVADIVKKYSGNHVRIALDAAQSAPHMQLHFAKLPVDFLAFSGHKMLAPMGSGGLFVKRSLLESGEMQPWLFGGGMIDSVELQQTRFHPNLSERFTAGTPDVASAVGLAAACTYLSELGMADVEQHDRELVASALEKLTVYARVEVIGPLDPEKRLGSVAFMYKGVHAHDVAQILNSEGVAVRSGHHCTMPLHQQFEWQATVRASFQVYNSTNDIDMLMTALDKVATVFGLE